VQQFFNYIIQKPFFHHFMFDLNLFICKTKIKFNKVNFQTLHNKKSTYFPLSNHCKNKRSFLSQKQACNNMQNLVK